MSWSPFVLLILTFVGWQLTQRLRDRRSRCFGTFLAVLCLTIGLATAPVLLRSIILLGLVVIPTFLQMKRNPCWGCRFKTCPAAIPLASKVEVTCSSPR